VKSTEAGAWWTCASTIRNNTIQGKKRWRTFIAFSRFDSTYQRSLHLADLSLLPFPLPNLSHAFPFPVLISLSRRQILSSYAKNGGDKAKENSKWDSNHCQKAAGCRRRADIYYRFPVPDLAADRRCAEARSTRDEQGG
jgi:hypothetical protein